MSGSLIGTSLLIINTLLSCPDGDLCEQKNVAIATENPQTIEEEFKAYSPLGVAQLSGTPSEVKLDVPFSSQAPHRNWNPPYDEACEETSLIMVEYYLRGAELSANAADTEIKYLVQLEDRKGWEVDISAGQVASLANQSYKRTPHLYTGKEVTISNIKHLLASGYPVIIPAAGRDLGNPNFIGSGPPYHMIVLTGYNKDNFYAHDPGTQFGEHYEYPQDVLYNAIHEWTGDRGTVRQGEKAMLVLEDTRDSNFVYVAEYSF